MISLPKKLPKGSRLYLKNYPALKYNFLPGECKEEEYNLTLWHIKMDNENFGWWTAPHKEFNSNENFDEQKYVRMDSENVEIMSHMTLLSSKRWPFTWKRGERVEHKSLKLKGTLMKELFVDGVLYLGVKWDQGSKSKYQFYFWNRFDKLKKIKK